MKNLLILGVSLLLLPLHSEEKKDPFAAVPARFNSFYPDYVRAGTTIDREEKRITALATSKTAAAKQEIAIRRENVAKLEKDQADLLNRISYNKQSDIDKFRVAVVAKVPTVSDPQELKWAKEFQEKIKSLKEEFFMEVGEGPNANDGSGAVTNSRPIGGAELEARMKKDPELRKRALQHGYKRE
jgi:hypothetical protein